MLEQSYLYRLEQSEQSVFTGANWVEGYRLVLLATCSECSPSMFPLSLVQRPIKVASSALSAKFSPLRSDKSALAAWPSKGTMRTWRNTCNQPWDMITICFLAETWTLNTILSTLNMLDPNIRHFCALQAYIQRSSITLTCCDMQPLYKVYQAFLSSS